MGLFHVINSMSAKGYQSSTPPIDPPPSGGYRIPSAIAPTDVSGLFAWYDATNSANVTQSSGLVSQLNDISGNGRHLTATGSLRPTWQSSGGAGNKSYVEFVAGKILERTGLSLSQPFTVLIYFKYDPTQITNGQNILRVTDSVAALYFNFTDYYGIASTWKGINMYGGSIPQFNWKNQWLPNQWNLLKHVNANTPNDYDIWVNLESRTPKLNINIGTITADQLRFGNSAMSVHEIIVYSGKVSESQLEGLSAYFYNKYSFNFRTNVIAFGDSITYGVQSGHSAAAPYLYQMEELTGVQFYNYGVSGARVRLGTAPTTLEGRYTEAFRYRQPGVKLHFQYGSNDCADGSTSASNIAAWKAAYKGIIQNCISQGWAASDIYLLTPPNSTASFVAGNLVRTATAIQEIASELGVVLVDCYAATLAAGLDCADVPDQIHPNDAISNKMRETFLSVF